MPNYRGVIRPKNLWDAYTIGEVVDQLTSWGNGSGEELLDWLESSGLSRDDARLVLNGLNMALKG